MIENSDDLTTKPKSLLAREAVNGLDANNKLAKKIEERLRMSLDYGENGKRIAVIDDVLFQDIIKIIRGYAYHTESIIRQGVQICRIENRRKDQWDILKKRCDEDEMFKENWDSMMVLLKFVDEID